MKRILLFLVISVVGLSGFAQGILSGGNVRGSYQADIQTYEPNEQLGISAADINGKKFAMNAFGNVIYTNKNFTAGIRYEAFLPQMAGYEAGLEGKGIANRYLTYHRDKFEITVGNFYEQFGNGLIFRTFEEWSLGYDNSMDGLRIKTTPLKGLTLKGIYGVQRKFWEPYKNGNRGIIKGVDGDFYLNDIMPGLRQSSTNIFLGGSMVSRYQKADPYSPYKQPQNVGAFAGRFAINNSRFNFQGEYAYKINDPSAFNKNIFKDGKAGFLSASYSQKGLGLTFSAKYLDNMSFKSDRDYLGNGLDIGFQPPLTKTHSYSLEAMYPYASQLNGEFTLSGKLIFTIPKKTLLGGKYGTNFEVNYAHITSIDKEPVNDTIPIGEPGTLGYQSRFFVPGDLLYFEDFNVEMHKKWNKKWSSILAYTNLVYNNDVVREGLELDENVYYAQIFTADITYKIQRKKAIRGEFQYLQMQQDKGDWFSALFEYTIAPKWFFMLKDEWNIPNQKHFYAGAFGYTRHSTKFQVSYGLQREGITCVGGICRAVPQTSGLTITIMSSF